MDLRALDLNLLLVFDELMRRRSVSRVAESLGVTQPAVSRALARLRKSLGDELFQRTPAGMAPTSRAAELAGPVGDALATLRETLTRHAGFDPARSERRFTLRLSDIAEICILPRLLQVLLREAPGVSIDVVRSDIEHLKSDLESGTVDLAVGLVDGLEAGFHQREYFRQGYVCAFRPGHPLDGRPMTLADFRQADHVVVTAQGSGHAKIDQIIERRGIVRRVRLRIRDYLALERILRESDLIATVPEALVRPEVAALGLAHGAHPLALPRLPVHQVWHGRVHRDPGHRWLRQLIAERCAMPAAAATQAPPAPRASTRRRA